MFDKRLLLVGLFFLDILLHGAVVFGWSSITDIYKMNNRIVARVNSTCDAIEAGDDTSRYNLIFALRKRFFMVG